MKLTKIPSAMQRSLLQVLKKYPLVMAIVSLISVQGGRALLVGGAVRDLLLESPIKDLDIEVHGISQEQLQKILRQFGPVDTVGKAFGVLRVHPLDVDWSLPRVDASGRKPQVTVDPYMELSKAFERRDLTVNALGVDLETYELIDPFDGYSDLKCGVLRSPNPTFFAEDPLRFYRVMQFVGRFEMEPDAELNKLCSSIDLSAVSVERIEQEFNKLLLQSARPSLGIRWLHAIGRLQEVLPEVAALVATPQDSSWHPEGNVFEHTMQVLDAAAALPYDSPEQKLVGLYAALCHDLGKAVTTKKVSEHIKSTGHAKAGVPLAKQLLKRIMRNKDRVQAVAKLVEHHMAPGNFVKNGAKPAAYKRLAMVLAPDVTLQQVALLATADKRGRNPDADVPLKKAVAEVDRFIKKADACRVLTAPEKPLLQGSDIIDSVAPGPQMGAALRHAYELQIAEGISDKAELKRRLFADLASKGV